MRVRFTQARAPRLHTWVQVGAAAFVLAGVAGCSGGGSAGATALTPDLPTTTTTPSASAAAPTPSASTSGIVVITADPSAILAQTLQQQQCKTALEPLFTAVTAGTATQAKVLSVTPAAAQPAMQQAFTILNQILAGNANAIQLGQASAAKKPIADFCATPAGAQFVGTTPVTALKPPPPVKTTKPPTPVRATTTHHP
jgi:hypothetical protein